MSALARYNDVRIPWIPAFAGMTVGTFCVFPAKAGIQENHAKSPCYRIVALGSGFRRNDGLLLVRPKSSWALRISGKRECLGVAQQDLSQFLGALGHHLVARIDLHRFHTIETFGDA